MAVAVPAAVFTSPPGKIQHVVVIFQENRTPDISSRSSAASATDPPEHCPKREDSTGQIVQLQPPLAEAWDMGTAITIPDLLEQWARWMV